MTPSGIEPVTFRFVVQRLIDCANAVPINKYMWIEYFIVFAGELFERV